MFRADTQVPPTIASDLCIVFQRGELVTDMRSREPCLLQRARVIETGWSVEREHFLGYWHDQPCFTLEIEASAAVDPMQFQRGNLYKVLGRVEEPLFALTGRALQILAWARDHRYCGRCGQGMTPVASEYGMRCEPCGLVNYPRIAPCVIVLVTRGPELLLARNVNFPRPMFSTLAGFIEAGETAEETAVREVREEVGVEITDLRYFQSQSWPFPNQLMLGFFATWAGGDIVCDPSEIAEAAWFDHRDLPPVPPAVSISGQLIRHYIENYN